MGIAPRWGLRSVVRVTQGFASLRPGLSNPAPFGAFPATPILDAAGIPRVSQNRARLFRLRLGLQIVGQVFQPVRLLRHLPDFDLSKNPDDSSPTPGL
jgi:hypothetical protein